MQDVSPKSSQNLTQEYYPKIYEPYFCNKDSHGESPSIEVSDVNNPSSRESDSQEFLCQQGHGVPKNKYCTLEGFSSRKNKWLSNDTLTLCGNLPFND